MNFLSPFGLLWLLPIGGAIVTMYLLRLKRRDVTVASTFLWQAVIQDTQANAPFQKLRKNLLLALQLLLALLLVFVIARPFLWASGLGGKTVALVLDASASMRATDEGGGRWNRAVVLAREAISRKAPGDAVALVWAGDKPVVIAPLTTDRDKLFHALDLARPTDAPGDMREAISFAGTLVASRAGAQVTVITDGDFGRVEPLALGGATVAFVPVGKRAANIGVTAFDVRDTLGGGEGRQAFVTVQNFGTQTATFPLNIVVNGNLADAHEMTLKSGETKSETFDNLRASQGGQVTAQLDVRDDLESDNTATVRLSPRRTLKILLVTDGNPFLERVLNTDAHVALDAVAPASFKTADAATHDMTVWDNTAPPADLPPGRYLFWGSKSLGTNAAVPVTATTTGGAGATGEADRPQILDWSRTHPLMRFVDLANVKLLRARMVFPLPWAQTLVEGDSGPLLVAGEKNNIRSVYVAWNLLDSDMPLRVAFPIFLTNCTQWLTARPGDGGGVLRPGEVAVVPVPSGAKSVTITRPDNQKDTVPAPATGPVLYDKTTLAGTYRVSSGISPAAPFYVSLLSAQESNTSPIAKPVVAVTDAPDTTTGKPAAKGAGPTNAAASSVAGGARSVRVRREVWPVLALLALGFLAVEWAAYHRRA